MSLTIGGLLGDVFFHTLPQLKKMGGEGPGHDEKDDETNFMIIMGIMAFFMVERLTQQYLVGDKVVKADKEKQVRYQSFVAISMISDFIRNFTNGLSIVLAY